MEWAVPKNTKEPKKASLHERHPPATLASSNKTKREADRGSSFGATYDLQRPRSVHGRLANAKSEVAQNNGYRASLRGGRHPPA